MEIPLDVAPYRLREFRLADRTALQQLADNPRVSAYLRDAFPSPYTAEDARRWLSYCIAAEGKPLHLAVASESGGLIGGIGLTEQADVERHSVEVGYWLGEPWWGRGIAAAAVRAMTGYAFWELSFRRCFAGVYAGNEPSRRVLEKAGYQAEGVLRKHVFKRGRFLDKFMYGRLRSDLDQGGSAGQPAK